MMMKSSLNPSTGRFLIVLAVLMVFLMLATSSNQLTSQLNIVTGAGIAEGLSKNASYLLLLIATVPIAVICYVLKRLSTKRSKAPNIIEENLDRKLRSVNAEIQGYNKPAVLSAPKRKKNLDAQLEQINNELSNLKNAEVEKVLVKKTVPFTPEEETPKRKRGFF
ncbi:MAG: hypothetical protein AB1668_06370 [Nanoarchaeota archaeon]